MDDVQFDVMLRGSAPATRPRDEIAAHSNRILSEARAGRRRRLQTWTAGIGLSAVLIGGGSAALAGSGVETPWGWMADNVFSIPQNNGEICFQGMRISFAGADQDAPIVADAREILSGIDVNALDTTQTEEDLAWEATRSKNNPDPLNPDELKQSAIGTMVAQIVFDELAARGYDLNPSPISVETQTTDCSQ